MTITLPLHQIYNSLGLVLCNAFRKADLTSSQISCCDYCEFTHTNRTTGIATKRHPSLARLVFALVTSLIENPMVGCGSRLTIRNSQLWKSEQHLTHQIKIYHPPNNQQFTSSYLPPVFTPKYTTYATWSAFAFTSLFFLLEFKLTSGNVTRRYSPFKLPVLFYFRPLTCNATIKYIISQWAINCNINLAHYLQTLKA